MMTDKHIDIIKATASAVEEHARAITDHFYPLLFSRYPQTIEYFNQTHQTSGAQRQALANAVIAYAKNIDRLGALSAPVSLIVQKHCSLGVQPDHYPLVGECLLESIAVVLGDAATDDILAAWGEAYNQLATILINAEQQAYEVSSNRNGGWEGEKEFQVMRIDAESSLISSFLLKSVNDDDLIDFLPGQYIAVIAQIDGQTIRRNYSLSDKPGQKTLRISVKREQNGLMSNYLHSLKTGDVLKLTPPSGNFVLSESHPQKPLFLVTAGVGITPAISMLNSAINSGRDIHFIHAAKNGEQHAFRSHVDNLAQQHSQLTALYLYDEALEGDSNFEPGRLTKAHLEEHLPASRDVDFYFLGPAGFMQQVFELSQVLSIPQESVHYEFFGPLKNLSEKPEKHAI